MRSLTLLALVLPTLAQAQSRPDGWYVAQARSAARDCLSASTEHGDPTTASVDTVSACFAGGFITNVTFATDVSCPPNQVCSLRPTELLATVQFGCDNAIIAVECHGSATCDYGGSTYFPGDAFPSEDGCNTCYCGDNGLVACTKMACVQEPTCMVTGCSGQLCVSTDTGEVATTCEYRPEYACLAETTCGNFGPGGACAWDDTPQYLECLDTVDTTPVSL